MRSESPVSSPTVDAGEERSGKSLWQVSLVIMLIVFGPAMLAWMVLLMKHSH